MPRPGGTARWPPRPRSRAGSGSALRRGRRPSPSAGSRRSTLRLLRTRAGSRPRRSAARQSGLAAARRCGHARTAIPTASPSPPSDRRSRSPGRQHRTGAPASPRHRRSTRRAHTESCPACARAGAAPAGSTCTRRQAAPGTRSSCGGSRPPPSPWRSSSRRPNESQQCADPRRGRSGRGRWCPASYRGRPARSTGPPTPQIAQRSAWQPPRSAQMRRSRQGYLPAPVALHAVRVGPTPRPRARRRAGRPSPRRPAAGGRSAARSAGAVPRACS